MTLEIRCATLQENPVCIEAGAQIRGEKWQTNLLRLLYDAITSSRYYYMTLLRKNSPGSDIRLREPAWTIRDNPIQEWKSKKTSN